jgi:hypothetical protein
VKNNKHSFLTFDEAVSEQANTPADSELLNALANDIERHNWFATGPIIASQLRVLAAQLDDDDEYEASALLSELAQKAEKAPGEQASISFVSAGHDRGDASTLIVSPRVAALVMDLLETLAVERDFNRDIA